MDAYEDRQYRYETAERLAKDLMIICSMPSTHQSRGAGPDGTDFDVFLSQVGTLAHFRARFAIWLLLPGGSQVLPT